MTHYPQHKTFCKWRAAELFQEKLFQEHSGDREECPICMIPLPFDGKQINFRVCCGKNVCSGCLFAQNYEGFKSGKDPKDALRCPFCRSPTPDNDETTYDLIRKCMEKNNAEAIYVVAGFYAEGKNGYPEDVAKAIELLEKAGKLGKVAAYELLGITYMSGRKVEKDFQKSRHFFELAAIAGNARSRYFLASLDYQAHNYGNARQHFMIGAKAGDDECQAMVQSMFDAGILTEEKYTEILRAYQKQHEDRKSPTRDAALANGFYGEREVSM